MFLTVARTNLDEIPLRICATRAEAVMCMLDATEKTIRDLGRKVMGVDDAGICNVAVIEFDTLGIPRDLAIVRDWDEPSAVSGLGQIPNPPSAEKRKAAAKPKAKKKRH